MSQFGDALWLPDLSRRVKETAKGTTAQGWTTRVDQTSIDVVSGRLEKLATPAPEVLVVLPANEYFDDECIRDTRSALGAFVEEHFPRQKEAFLDAVRKGLVGKDTIGAATMADHRLSSVVVPLIGSGHGGLRIPAALSALMVAFIEVLRRPAAHGIRNVTLVVFQKAPDEKPAMSPRLVRRIMARAVDLYAA